jgi:hypothetical protein
MIGEAQFLNEIERFAHFLNQLIADEAKSSPFASELFGIRAGDRRARVQSAKVGVA